MTVLELLRRRITELPIRGLTPRKLAHSLSIEAFGYPQDRATYSAVVRFRRLGHPARISRARTALEPAP